MTQDRAEEVVANLKHPLILIVKWPRRFHGTRVAR